MKILATSDLHGNLKDLNFEGIDLVLFAGDFMEQKGFGKWRMQDQKKWLYEKLFPLVEKHANVQFVAIPGNHDLCLDFRMTSKFKDVNWNIQWPNNFHLLIDEAVVIGGLKIYGTPWEPVISLCWAYEAEHDKKEKKFSKIPENLDILLTHTPPHIPDSLIDRSLDHGGYEAFGSGELAQAIYEKKPRNVFCGHIHTGLHGGVPFENTMVYNVSRVNENYEIAYEPEIVDISPMAN